jgi:hypothetical protein
MLDVQSLDPWANPWPIPGGLDRGPLGRPSGEHVQPGARVDGSEETQVLVKLRVALIDECAIVIGMSGGRLCGARATRPASEASELVARV